MSFLSLKNHSSFFLTPSLSNISTSNEINFSTNEILNSNEVLKSASITLVQLEIVPEDQEDHMIDSTYFSSNCIKKPIEIVFNEEKETKTLKEIPFLVYDRNTNSYKDFCPDDGYLYYMTRANQKNENAPKLYFLLSITIFSESYSDLQDSLKAIYRNINSFIESGFSPQQICIIIIFDGILPISSEIKNKIFRKLDKKYNIPYNLTLDAREKEFLIDTKRINEGKPPLKPYYTSSYVYEWKYGPDEYYEESIENRNMSHYLNIICNVKLRNAQKLSSVVWFFRGYCELFMPQYCSLMDCGTIPFDKALWKKLIALEGNKNIGGCCGIVLPSGPSEIDEKDQKILNQYDPVSRYLHKVFDIRHSQVFEYLYGHVIERSYEGLLGINFVLPGCFATFRWDAIRKRPSELMKYEFLDSRFVKIVLDPFYKESEAFSIEEANMCLAEDQVLTSEVYTKMHCKYVTKYIPDAVALTDPVKTFPILVKQRKRWINGAWYAFELMLSVFWKKMRETKHNPFRKFIYNFYVLSIVLNMINRWFVLAFYLCVVDLLTLIFIGQHSISKFPLLNSELLMMSLFLIAIYFNYHLSLFYRLDKQIKLYVLSSTILSTLVHLYSFLVIYNLGYVLPSIVDPNQNTSIEYAFFFSLVIFFTCLYMIPLALNYSLVPSNFLTIVIAYVYHYPTLILYLHIYSFCNISDLTWGTKEKEKEINLYKLEKNSIKNSNFCTWWLITNFLLACLIICCNSNHVLKVIYVLTSGFIYAFFLFIKITLSIISKIKYDCYDLPKNIFNFKIKHDDFKKESQSFDKFINDEESKLLESRIIKI